MMNSPLVVAWTARDTWLVIEVFILSMFFTLGAFFVRARRRGAGPDRTATYRRSLWGLAAFALLTVARLELHKYK
jgi:uncharacterized membrane protein SirB2